jgi:hypothetical protein
MPFGDPAGYLPAVKKARKRADVTGPGPKNPLAERAERMAGLRTQLRRKPGTPLRKPRALR